MFCQTCGNKIPDDVTICPHCGQEVSASDDMASLLSELSFVLDDMNNGAPAKSGPETVSDQSAAGDNSVAAEQPGQQTADTAEPNDVAVAVEMAEGSLISDALNVSQEAPAGEPVLVSKQASAATQQPVRKTSEKSSHSGNKTASNGSVKKKSATSSNGKKKKKKKKKKGGSAVLGVIIGLLVALLLIALAAGYMLWKLGFFDSINASDEELLYSSAAEMPDATETTIMPSPSAVAVSADEETPAAEETADSALETEPVPSEEPEEAVEVSSFELDSEQETELSFYSRGETAQIEYKIEPEAAESYIEWTSDDISVATVNQNGVITAKRGGNCTITGTCGDFSVSIAVSCSFSVPETVLDMNYEDVTMSYEGQTIALEIESEDLTMADQSAINWESSDEEVATVDDAGNVTAVADGTAIISASFEDYTASCIIRCVNVTGTAAVNSEDAPYVINYEDVTLTRKGEYFQLKLTAIENSEDPDVTWVSDDKNIATVDAKGVVTAVADGTCYVTTTIDGFEFQCIVRVNITG